MPVMWEMTEQDLRERGVDGDAQLLRLAEKLGVPEPTIENDRQRKQLADHY